MKNSKILIVVIALLLLAVGCTSPKKTNNTPTQDTTVKVDELDFDRACQRYSKYMDTTLETAKLKITEMTDDYIKSSKGNISKDQLLYVGITSVQVGEKDPKLPVNLDAILITNKDGSDNNLLFGGETTVKSTYQGDKPFDWIQANVSLHSDGLNKTVKIVVEGYFKSKTDSKHYPTEKFEMEYKK